MEDQLLSVMGTTVRQCNTKKYVLYLLDQRGQIQQGHWESVHVTSEYH